MKLVFMVTDNRTFNGYNTHEIHVNTLEDVKKVERYIKRKMKLGQLISTSLYSGQITEYMNKELKDLIEYLEWMLSDEETSEDTFDEETSKETTEKTLEDTSKKIGNFTRVRTEIWKSIRNENIEQDPPNYYLVALSEATENILMIYQSSIAYNIHRVNSIIQEDVDEKQFLDSALMYNHREFYINGQKRMESWGEVPLDDVYQIINEDCNMLITRVIDVTNKDIKGYEKYKILVKKAKELPELYHLDVIPFDGNNDSKRIYINYCTLDDLYEFSRILKETGKVSALDKENCVVLQSGTILDITILYLRQ